ncbi:hypothetical protein [Thalassospira alkalitolerans]|uniref:Lipoprotein n=1 Tax=Thalassospira alkalitolerans TaxID=1293890 RepID=A0A1Y2L649_9PROT|nr:hypothetical protein [Thalassospira alkalitolerans]OSQ43362.1 hypothetical protein TALK_20695 [Thalassospira alkalitolerans]
MIQNKIPTVFAVGFAAMAFLLLGGCQTTQSYNAGHMAEYGPERARLLQIARDICIDHLGDAAAIDRLALPLANEPPVLEEEQIGFETVTTRVYGILYKGRRIGALSNGEGRVCSVAAAAGIGIPDYFTDQLGLVFEDRDFGVVGSQIDEMRYGYREMPTHPVKKIVTRINVIGKIDVILFMTDEAYQIERGFIDDKTTMITNAMRPEIRGDDMPVKVLQDICTPNMGNTIAMREAAGQFTRTDGKVVTDKRLRMFGNKIEIFPLLHKPDGTISVVMMSPDAKSCGIWEIGAPKPVKNLFAHFGVEVLGEKAIDDGLLRYGYRGADETVLINLTRVRPEQTINGMFFMQREAFDRIPKGIAPALPQGI